MDPYGFGNRNPIRFVDPTGMSGEDWIKKGNKIFFDPSANSENYKDKYGKDAILVDKHNIYDKRGYISESYDFHSDGTYTFSNGVFSSNHSVYDVETHSISRSTIIEGLKCTSCPTINRSIATNSIQYQMGSAPGQLGVAAYYGLQTFGEIVAGEAVLGAVGLSGGISLSGYAAAGDGLVSLGVQTSLRTLPVTNALLYDARIVLQTNLYHSFPNSFDAHIINNGSWSQRIKDGANWYEMSGNINGVKGNYEIGLTHWNKVFHRSFKPGK